jgi:hypothetical protein
MMKRPLVGVLLVLVTLALVAIPAGGGAIPSNVDVSQRVGNESEEAIAVNPTNPQNIVVVTNIQEGFSGLFEGVSFDGGQTWTRKIIATGDTIGGGADGLGDSCCDPSLAFDEYGNLFLAYLYNLENVVPVALSTDGGLTFDVIANIPKPQPKLPGTKGPSRHGEYRFVDQETIVTGEGSVWVVYNSGGPMSATGARVTGLGRDHVGRFGDAEVIPGTNNCTYGDIAIGPGGKVMNVCTLTESGQGGGKLFVNVDPDGLGPAGFGDRVFVEATHVGGFDFIAPQPDRSVDAEPGLAWDRTRGAHRGRVYLVYTLEEKNESDDTNVYVRYSDDDGKTWSAGTRVNDDTGTNSQFMSKIALDPTTGHAAVVWYDARNDLGTGGAGDTDGVPNDDAQFWGAFTSDGKTLTFTPNVQISAGTSNSHVSGNGIDYGDYSGLAFYGGVAHPAWSDNSNSDNSNSTGTNPDGTLKKLDIYTAAVAG